MKIGDQKSGQIEEGSYLNSFHSKVIGQYVVKVNGRNFNCLLKQTHQTWTKEEELEISSISQRYVTTDFVNILHRGYYSPTQKRK